MAEAEDDEEGLSPTSVWSTVARSVLTVFVNVTVLTSLLVYFGWRRSETQSSRLGIDQATLGMSTQEYVLRSVGSVTNLLLGVGVIGLLWIAFDRVVAPRLEGRSWLKAVCLVVLVLVLAIATALLEVWRPSLRYVSFPLFIAIAMVVAIDLGWLRSHPSPKGRDRYARVALLSFGWLIVVVCLFWATSNYADVRGRDLADALDCKVAQLPGVVLTSEKPLFLPADSIERTLLDDQGVTAHRYVGLRLLENTGGRLFLIPDQWRLHAGTVIVLPDSDPAVRFDFVRDPARDRATAVAAQNCADGSR
ncbi:MAG TPA: hypothetical protein VJM33_19905 [Microthrixaceae bacterium]|nr:hypothetical protein [Microthrixaceae bacterium]